jgi:hypothetical protein
MYRNGKCTQAVRAHGFMCNLKVEKGWELTAGLKGVVIQNTRTDIRSSVIRPAISSVTKPVTVSRYFPDARESKQIVTSL